MSKHVVKRKKRGEEKEGGRKIVSRYESVVFVIYSSLLRDKLLVKLSAIRLIISYNPKRERYAPTY